MSNGLGLDAYVRFLGRLENTCAFYNMLDLFVMPSFYEGMSNSILEAMSCEVPVCVSDIPSNREIFARAKAHSLCIGECFAAFKARSIADSVVHLLRNDPLHRLGENARKIVVMNYAIGQRIELEMHYYSENQRNRTAAIT